MKNNCLVFLSLVFILLLCSCEYGLYEAFGRRNDISSRSSYIARAVPPSVPASGTYQVAVITDVHFGAAKERFDSRFLDWLKLKKPQFVVCLGDVMEHGFDGEGEDYRRFTEQIKQICGNNVYTIAGNHDLYNSGWDVFRAKIYPHNSFYYFNTGNFSWYFIDSASGFLGNAQMKSLRSAISRDASPKIVLTHIPVYSVNSPVGYFSLQNTHESDELLSLFATENVKIVLEGHTHKYEAINIGGFLLYNVPGYLSAESWALLTINESNGTVQAEIVN